jgi:CheY-like chemotaxis protein
MRQPRILLVEDNPDHVLLIQRAFRKAGVQCLLQVVEHGEAAVEFLQTVVTHDKPDVILLDLKLPRKNGLEVLAWIRSRPGLRRIPVVVLTSSSHNQDVKRAYDLGANSYLVKPVHFDDLLELMKRVHLYWSVSNLSAELEAEPG